MGIPKIAKRATKPSQKFLNAQEVKRIVAEQKVPDKGPVKLFLDDERSTPPGCTLVRTARDFIRILKNPTIADRVTHMSLDYYLGADEPNGSAVAEELGQMFKEDPSFLPKLEAIGLHSSELDEALKMSNLIDESLPLERRKSIWMTLGFPDAMKYKPTFPQMF